MSETTDFSGPRKCDCGAAACGLVFIRDEERYQCGDCVREVYAEVRRLEGELAVVEDQYATVTTNCVRATRKDESDERRHEPT